MDVAEHIASLDPLSFSQPIVPGMFGLNTPLLNAQSDRDILEQQPINARVLYAEDHYETLTVMTLMLNSLSYEAVPASCGSEAIEKAKDRHFDIIISDISFPDMDGYTLLKEIRDHRYVPAIAVTGHEPSEIKDRCRQAGFLEVLQKPLDIVRLHTAIQKILRTATTAAANQKRWTDATDAERLNFQSFPISRLDVQTQATRSKPHR